MTSAQVVETSVTNNSSFQNYTHPDDHTIRTNNYMFPSLSVKIKDNSQGLDRTSFALEQQGPNPNKNATVNELAEDMKFNF